MAEQLVYPRSVCDRLALLLEESARACLGGKEMMGLSVGWLERF